MSSLLPFIALTPAGAFALTEEGFKPAGETQSIWDGSSFSATFVEPTHAVYFSNGSSIGLSEASSFALHALKGTKINHLEDLRAGIKLEPFIFPVVTAGSSNPLAYRAGFVEGSLPSLNGENSSFVVASETSLISRLGGVENSDVEGVLSVKTDLLNPQELDVASRLDWVAGVLDSAGTVALNDDVQVVQSRPGLLDNLQMVLWSLGVDSKTEALPNGKMLTVTSGACFNLDQMGLKCERLYVKGKKFGPTSFPLKIVDVRSI